jgi:hypothetical protein
MATLVRNKELLLKTLATVENAAQQGRWLQGWWFRTEEVRVEEGAEINCGTAGCFFGWAGTISGLKMFNDGGLEFETDGYHHVNEWGTAAFGLTRDESDVLSFGDNSLEDLRYLVDALVNDEDITEYCPDDWSEE